MTDYTDLKRRLETAHADSPQRILGSMIFAEAFAAIAALEAERDELLDDVKAFLPMWAIEYARRAGMPEGHLHPQHYDRMAQIGCRMVAFTRAALVQQPAADVAQENLRNPPMQG